MMDLTRMLLPFSKNNPPIKVRIGLSLLNPLNFFDIFFFYSKKSLIYYSQILVFFHTT